MPNSLFKAMLSKRNEAEKKLNPYVYVMNIINNEFRLRGTVRKIFVYED